MSNVEASTKNQASVSLEPRSSNPTPDVGLSIPTRGNSLSPSSKPLPSLPPAIITRPPQLESASEGSDGAALRQGGGRNSPRVSVSQKMEGGENKGDAASSLQPLLAQALARAELAVKLDGESKYVEALQAYCDTILIFEMVLEKADEAFLGIHADSEGRRENTPVLLKDDRKRLIELRNTYVQRVGVLLSTLPSEYTAWYNSRATARPPTSRAPSTADIRSARGSVTPFMPLNPYEAVMMADPSIAEPPEPPPSNPELRVFWLMRLLARSMTTGGFLTNGLYVPREVWIQSGAKFTAMETKLAACNEVIKEIDILDEREITKTDEMARKLMSVLKSLEHAKKTLSKKLRFIDLDSRSGPSSPLVTESNVSLASTSSSSTSSLLSPSLIPLDQKQSRFTSWGSKLSKSMEKLTKERPADSILYIETLLRFFSAAGRLEKVLIYYSSLPPVRNVPVVLARVRGCVRLLWGVFCMFVGRDLEALLERFLKKGRQVVCL
ncbi:hypothetical protein SpCBS45565_g01226 [Spizellomyces sp. 'palustris']|nr:hypothetical protein SpCBS45565_g01226 [Spizellomyces sp. 'palustris']